MQEAAKVRRAELIQEISRYRRLLSTVQSMRFTSSEQEEAIAKHNREITEKLRLMEDELHGLNVELIREGLPADPS